ncbi:MAG: M20 family metallopeptidase [Anaerolineaceae bacterium]
MEIYEKALKIQAETIALRRQLHRNPELSFQEHQTSAFVAEKLTSLGFEVTTGVGQTGVVGLLRGQTESPCILLRFDMDALPITEENQFGYISCNPGTMHACGHDAHMAIGLGVARLLAESEESLNSTIKIIFQPAEEVGLGALAMIEAGVLSNPKPDCVIGLHVWNEKPLGWIGATSRPIMAGSDMFNIRIIGRGGHGAAPQQAIDPILTASHLVNSLQSIVSRNINPLEQAVISVGSIHGGTASNIIPDEVELTGTIRYFNAGTQTLLHHRLREITEGIANAFNCQFNLEIVESTRPVVNDPKVTDLAIQSLRAFDQDLEIDTDYRTLISEDMVFFLERIPGVFLFMGSGAKDNTLSFPHHHPRFDIQEDCMTTAIAVILELVKKISESKA